jgi:Kef-type K+ transport system membrane component KefB
MSNAEFGALMVPLLVLVGAAHLFGRLFARFRQPQVAGEIFAGVVFGPAVLGRFAPGMSFMIFGDGAGDKNHIVLGFLYNFGLLLLMFASGTEIDGLFQRRDRREIAWLGIVGTGLPLALTFLAAPLIPLDLFAGTVDRPLALLLVLSISMAVTSIPVISRILHDLHLLDTRFARLILGVAVLEDIALWALLAVATTLATSGSLPYSQIAVHVARTVIYLAVGLVVMPRLLKRAAEARWNIFVRASPIAYVATVLLAYCSVAAVLDVNLVFAAFLAGYAIGARTNHVESALKSLIETSFAVFVPIYFAIVGYQLDVTKSFSLTTLAAVLVVASAVKLLSAGLGARLAGFGWRACVNLSVALNARGGPGIVLASIAFDLGIINAAFYTTLVLVAVLTSQMAGAWLDYVLRQGWPLLSDGIVVRSPTGDGTASAPGALFLGGGMTDIAGQARRHGRQTPPRRPPASGRRTSHDAPPDGRPSA